MECFILVLSLSLVLVKRFLLTIHSSRLAFTFFSAKKVNKKTPACAYKNPNRFEKAKRAGPTRRGACDAGNKGNDKGNREERLRFEIEEFVPPTIFPSFSAVGGEDCRVLNGLASLILRRPRHSPKTSFRLCSRL